MLLSDGSIIGLIAEGRITIDPYDESLVQPASIDIRLGSTFSVFRNGRMPYIDLKQPLGDLVEQHEHEGDEPFILHPGEFVLANTLEQIGLPDDHAAQLGGKSSLGRVGLVIHSTAGFIDPGFIGTITLEMSNDANLPITLYPGMPIGQLIFLPLDQPAEHPYRGKYQNQTTPEPSQMHKNFAESVFIGPDEIATEDLTRLEDVDVISTKITHRPTGFVAIGYGRSVLASHQDGIEKLRQKLAQC
jgi:dCTP deaminase